MYDLKFKDTPFQTTGKRSLQLQYLIFLYSFTGMISISDLPTQKRFVQTFSLEKVWLRNTLPTYDLDLCPKLIIFLMLS